MYCINCGSQTPDNSKFCLHCGAKISLTEPTAEPRPALDWEYKDFVYPFPPRYTWAQIGSGAYSEAGAKIEFWQDNQQEIRLELQKWLDKGWEPVGEVGPAGMKIRTFRDAKYGFFGWLFIIMLSLMMFFLPLLFIWNLYAEPTEFRVTLRAPKGTPVP